MKHSPTTRGFYDPEIHTAMPADVVDVTDAEYRQMLATPLEVTTDETAAILNALEEIDLASIRSIREYIVSKPDAPQWLKDMETAAQAERAKLK